MSNLELQGTVKKLFDTQTFASGFQKREMVILTQEQYPQPISIEFLQEKIGLLDNVKEGDDVKVGINISGREWTSPQGETKYFNSITGWRLEKNANAPAENKATKPAKKAEAVTESPFDDEEDDGLPF